MEDVRQLVQEEGREARNLVAFHVAVDTPSRVARKPPRGAPPPRRFAPRSQARLRSASAGRDKRSELRARYWALLFGDLQRAVGEIYNTVEAHENQNECQEVILVLENYTRDFKALSEWFKLKWEYDNTPPPQRPQSLAWEIRKTDFVRPESRRTHSVKSSPSVSGKNSPCLSGHNTPSGKNSPNSTGKASPGSGKISPRISGHSNTSPKGSIEFFSNKIASKTATKPEPKAAKETRLSDIKEKEIVLINVEKKDVSKEKEDKQTATIKKDINTSECPLANGPKNTKDVKVKEGVLKDLDDKENTKEKTINVLNKYILHANISKVIESTKSTVQESETIKERQNINVLKEKDGKESPKHLIEIGKAKEIPNATPKPVIVKTRRGKIIKDDNIASSVNEVSSQAVFTASKLDDMENEFLAKNLTENAAKNENLRNKDLEKDSNVSSKVTKTCNGPHKAAKSTEEPESNPGCSPNDSLQPPLSFGAITKVDDNKVDVTAIPELKPKAVSAKKKDHIITLVKKDSASKLSKEFPAKEAKVLETREKKESIKKATKESESITKEEDSSKNQMMADQKVNWAEECDLDLIKNKEDKKSYTHEKKEFVSDTMKPETKSPEPVKEDVKESKKDDNDLKKSDAKPTDVRPPKPAYSQAAAKPKLVTTKDENKTPTKTLYRSKTVVEIRPSSVPNSQLRQFSNRNQKSKCSYPFNLTTGRTSLFDAPGAPKVIATKRPIGRPQMAAGDARNQIKLSLKTRPPRPDSLKLNEDGDKQEKINPSFEKVKDRDEYSSSDTIVAQIDLSRIESSESLKTIVPDVNDVANSIEVLNVDGDKTDNDGWLTVKSRRLSRESKKSKSHWANRFHQPSATTSLPTLNMIESPKSETNPIVDSKLDRAKSEQPQDKPEKIVKVTDKNESKANAKDTSMIRQKSDVTGLKTRSSRNKAFKKEKNRDKKDSKLTKNRLHSSLESLTTGLARSQESTEQEGFDFDKWKAEFITTFKYMEEDFQITNHNEILKSADPTEMSEIAEMTSQIEENERKISLALDFQTEVDQQKLCREEDILNRQIMELQQVSDNDLDTETDDTETDAEILCEDSTTVPCQSSDNLTCRDLASCLEHHYESALEGMSWSERLDMLGALEELVARDPGRAQQLHAKLSQGIKRRGSLQDVLRKLQAKQARAEKQRMLLHTKRAKKIHHLLARVEEVKIAKKQLIDEKKNRMERRLQKAAENRDQHLKDIVRKAHDEEEKLREIAFIKQLEAENRRHEFLEQCRSLNTRLREMRKEQLDKLEQKAAREAAVGARRQALEAARKLHVESLLEKKKERDARREELKELKRQERDDAAREKAEGVKSRLSALAAAAELEADALRSRIRDKQDASQQRLESHLQAIREKATGPRQPTTSETQDQNSAASKEQDEIIEKLEQDRKDRERQKVLRKKARKLKQKIIATSKETSFGLPHPMQALFNPIVGKTQRVVNQVSALLAPHVPDYRPNNMFGYDVSPLKMKIIEDEKQDFKYDFEDKMGKKKKKRRNQEAQNDNQSQKNKNPKGNTPKKESKQKNEEQTNKKPANGVQKLANDTQKTINDSQKLTNDALKQTDDAEQSNDPKPTKAKRENSSKPNGIPNHENDDKSQKNLANGIQKDKNDEQNTQTTNEAQKLSKSNSICSSVSDRSTFVTTAKLDIPQLEKLINELYRVSTIKDCNDNVKPRPKLSDFTILAQLHMVKVLAQMLSLLAERDDLFAQISLKCVTMCVVICSRVMVCGGACALYVFTAPCAAHAISLLNNQLSKDLSDPREMELAKQLTDLVSFALDAALCESRLRPYNGEPNSPVTSVRARAHNLISYLCLSGCLSRAEHAGEACERLQTLVTLCADLCQPHKADVGPERASAVQSLRVALGTGLMGSRAEFCMLFAAGAELSRSRDFVRAARTAHLLRQLAELDHQLVQDAFGEGGWPLEFRAAVARLLSQHAPSDKEAPNSGAPNVNSQRLDLNLSEHMVLDLIVLVGYVVVGNPQLNETICDNWGVIKTLCTLPANWLVSETHSPALLPTLAVLAEHAPTANVISSELNLKMLETFVDSPEGQKIKLIEILKASRDKVAKKDKQGKKEKQNSTEGTDNQTNETRCTAKDVNMKEALFNSVKGNRALNNSDDEV